jgi:hypothetical protein
MAGYGKEIRHKPAAEPKTAVSLRCHRTELHTILVVREQRSCPNALSTNTKVFTFSHHSRVLEHPEPGRRRDSSNSGSQPHCYVRPSVDAEQEDGGRQASRARRSLPESC